jgi:predicted DNA binding protein
MPPGIRATIAVTTPVCPLSELSEAASATVDSVRANLCPSEQDGSTVEFSMETDTNPAVELTPLFSHGSTNRYRLTLDEGVNCPCQCLAQFGCPVSRYVAEHGTLTLVFHAADYDQLRAVVTELRDRFPEVDIRRFIESPAEESSEGGVLVDRGKLTARQREVLETAYERGYFDSPRRSNATEVAAELDINPSTFREHLAAAESKVLGDLLH